MCPRSDQCVKKHTTDKYFQGLISNKVDTVVFHNEALYKFRTIFQKHSTFAKEQS